MQGNGRQSNSDWSRPDGKGTKYLHLGDSLKVRMISECGSDVHLAGAALDYKRTKGTLRVCIGSHERYVLEVVIDLWHNIFSVTTDGRVEKEGGLGKGISSSFLTMVGLEERHRVLIDYLGGT